jgi:hypothetical protein
MKKIQTQVKTMLGTLAKSLATLSKQVEKIADKVKKLETAVPEKKTSVKKAAPDKKTPLKKKAAPAKKPALKTKAATGKKTVDKSGTVIDIVLSAIEGSKSGISIDEIKQVTQVEGRQLSNALYKLTKRDKIKSKSRGIYIPA